MSLSLSPTGGLGLGGSGALLLSVRVCDCACVRALRVLVYEFRVVLCDVVRVVGSGRVLNQTETPVFGWIG